MMRTCAPITLFVYNRPAHTKNTVEALRNNELASSSDLYVFSDGPKHLDDEAGVNNVREYLTEITGFSSVTVINRNTNWGLTKNIVDGVTHVVNRHGCVIVLEDDLVTSRFFLQFMNDALDCHRDTHKVWHITGWNYPLNLNGAAATFLWRVMNCWGWATWADRWRHYHRNPDELVRRFDQDAIKRFNLDGYHNFWNQVQANARGDYSTWAIFWYATIFMANGLCLNPTKTLVMNIGFDGSGVHRVQSGEAPEPPYQALPAIDALPLIENSEYVQHIKKYYQALKVPIYRRVIRKIKRMVSR